MKRTIIYDFETSGLSHNFDQPIEVALKIVEGEDIGYYHSYIKCDKPLTSFITDLTGITDEKLELEGKPLYEVACDLYNLFNVPDTLVVGYNILAFDNKFLRALFDKFGFTMPDLDYFDCCGEFKAELIGLCGSDGESALNRQEIALKKRVKGLRYKLSDACDRYGVDKRGDFHAAMSDVEYTHGVYLKQMELIKGKLPEPVKSKTKHVITYYLGYACRYAKDIALEEFKKDPKSKEVDLNRVKLLSEEIYTHMETLFNKEHKDK